MRWGHACAVALALWVSSAGAATVEGLTPRALVERSEVVFIGTVQSAESRYVPEEMAVVTDFSFAVEQVVKGPDKTLRHFELTQLGGEVVEAGNRVTQAVPGYAQFTAGERVMLFLERTATGRLVPTGLAQGKYTLHDDPKNERVVAVRDTHDLNILGNRADRRLLGVPETPNRMTLDQLMRVVRGQRPVEPVRVIRPALPETPQITLPNITSEESAR